MGKYSERKAFFLHLRTLDRMLHELGVLHAIFAILSCLNGVLAPEVHLNQVSRLRSIPLPMAELAHSTQPSLTVYCLAFLEDPCHHSISIDIY